MSFSSDIKQELNKTSNLSNKKLVKYELIGYLKTSNANISEKIIKYSTESDYNINRFSKLLSNLDLNHKIEILGKNFVVTLKQKEIDKTFFADDLENINEEEKKAVIRGMFLGAGSINNPEGKYHLEIILSNEENLKDAMELLQSFGFNPKKLVTKNKYSIYSKDGEEISNFLAFIGASKSVMEFENIRVQKEMRGKVNRLVNCEVANLNKTINASIEQIEAINKLKKLGKFNKLDDNLKEIANLRLQNPNMSLIELGKLLKDPVGKSGVNYRLKKIVEIANEIL